MKIEDPGTRQGAPLSETRNEVVREEREVRSRLQQLQDGVRLSGEARLAQDAIRVLQTSTAADGIRPDAVARGRALIESGQAGADTEALADAILDALLDHHEHDN